MRGTWGFLAKIKASYLDNGLLKNFIWLFNDFNYIDIK